MESKQVFLPALALGVGLGVGVATVCTQTFNRWADLPLSACVLESELLAQVVDGGESSVTFDTFPYYLSEETKALLTNAAFMHLKHSQLGKFTRNLSPASRSILLSGPTGTERYHQMLANALAHSFKAKLLFLDITDFSLKMQIKYASSQQADESMSSTKDSVYGLVQCIGGLFGSDFTTLSNGPRTVKSFLEGGGAASLKRSSEVKGSLKITKSLAFEDKALVVALYRVLMKSADVGPVILYLKDLEKIVLRGSKTVSLFQKMFNKLSGRVFVLSSRILEESPNEQVAAYVDEKAAALFPYKVNIKPPVDGAKLVSWKSQLEEDMKAIQAQDNRNHLSEVLDSNDVKCEDLDAVCFTDALFGNLIEEIVVSAISHHLMHTEEPQYCNGKLVISSKSIAYGLSLYQADGLKHKDANMQTESNPKPLKGLSESSKKEAKCEGLSEVVGEGEVPTNNARKKGDTDGPKNDPKIDASTNRDADASNKEDGAKTSAPATTKEVVVDNEFEKRIRPEIIPAGEIGVSFQDIGALEHVKEAMQELVMLPLQRPDLFRREGLIKPCKGILLFGPPGTGKTMLAKAVATEAGASFINVSMSTITSKWFGEDEKNVRALFTLASKVAPTIIFIDEVDSMLGQRSRVGEHEAMRKIKNEFMAHWDGLLSKKGERVLVLAVTNRPFDLDDAIIRRFERRIMVDLPDKDNRERILKAILAKETISNDVDYIELANMTEGYSGSDLKNLCTVAAYQPIRELLKKDKQDNGKDSKKASDLHTCKDASCSGSVKTEMLEPSLRPLNMEDLKQAKSQVSSSFAAEGAGMAELKEWNELFGEGGSRKKQQLSYFL